MSCLLQFIGPKLQFYGSWSSCFRVVELLPWSLLDIPDSFFYLAILEVSIHSTVGNFLVFLIYWLLEGVVCKSSIVSMVRFDFYPVRPGVSLKHFLCFYRFFWWQSSLQVHGGNITVVIQDDCCRAVTLLGWISLDLGYELFSAGLHLVNWYAFSRGRGLPDRASGVCGLGAPWTLSHGEIEAPSTLGQLHLEEVPWEYT